MGMVFQNNKGLIKEYGEEPSATITEMLVESGKSSVERDLAPLSSDEAKEILLKLDAMTKHNKDIASIFTEEAKNVITAVRALKSAKGISGYGGILGSGQALNFMWLRAKDIGGSLLNSDGTANKGVYGQANGTETWTYSHTAGTNVDLIPAQTMSEIAAVIHVGAMNPIEVPKINAYQFVLAGQNASPESIEYRVREGFGTDTLPVARFEKPVYVGPETRQQLTVHPWAGGNDKTQLLSLLITRVQALSL